MYLEMWCLCDLNVFKLPGKIFSFFGHQEEQTNPIPEVRTPVEPGKGVLYLSEL